MTGDVLALAVRAIDDELDAEFSALVRSLGPRDAIAAEGTANLLLLARVEQLNRREQILTALRDQEP